MSQTAELLRDAISYAPPATKTAAGLLGWWTPDGCYVCAPCTSRIIGRGCALPRGSQPSWDGDPVGVCVTCGPVEGSDGTR